MRIKFSIMAAVSSLTLAAVSTPAFAGHCAAGAPSCNVGVNVIAPAPAQFGPMTVHTQHPMGHLRQVNFQRSPNVSITRVHGMMQTAGLSDAPTGFTGGCHPTSTQYCRTDAGTPINIDFAPTPAPVIAAPYVAPAPVYTAPAQPVYTGRTFTGQGYDPSKFAPRQYGDNTFTPGIVNAPTSFVDRSPANAQAALNSGRAVTQPLANGGMTPAMGFPGPAIGMSTYSAPAPAMSTGRVTLPGTYAASPAMGRVTLPGTYSTSPAMGRVTLPGTYSTSAAPMVGMGGGQATAPVLTQNGTYASNVGSDGTYWEKTSGPTMFGNTMATQVICKRKLPTQVVNPVVNVPYAVPTPVPTCTPSTQGHSHQGHQHHNHAQFGHNHQQHIAMESGSNARYGSHGSRWIK